MRLYTVLIIFLFALFHFALYGCAKEAPFSIQVMPAILVEDPQQPPTNGWIRVEFAGASQTGPSLYDVAPDTLLTEWNIIAFKAASPNDSTHSVVIRLNAYSQQKMEKFSTEAGNLKKPLAVRIDGRWADFMPLLDRVTDRITLSGFMARDLIRLEAYIAAK